MRFFTFQGIGMKGSVLINDISGWTYRDPATESIAIAPSSNAASGLLFLKGGQSISVTRETCMDLEKLFGVRDLERMQDIG